MFWSLAAVSVAVRLLCMLWPANFDLESYSIVADLVLDGENVYASTNRYNYAPAWMGVVAALKWLAGPQYFRFAVCLLLCLTDVAIAALLRARGHRIAAALFLFSPWTILITGHHHMFDNVAILLGLLAVRWVETRPQMHTENSGLSALTIRDTLICAALIGASIVMKHILFLFPLWMAFRVRSFPRRAIWLGLPVAMFGLSFLPFLERGAAGISQNVLHYAASSNAPLFYMLSPNIVDLFMGCHPHPRLARVVFGAGLILAGMLLRRRSLFEWFVAYLLFLVLVSSAIWNQYLVIPVLFTVLYRNVWGLLYNLLAIPFYILEDSGFNYAESLGPGWRGIEAFTELYGHYVFISLLAACYAQAFWKVPISKAWSGVVFRMRESLRGHS